MSIKGTGFHPDEIEKDLHKEISRLQAENKTARRDYEVMYQLYQGEEKRAEAAEKESDDLRTRQAGATEATSKLFNEVLSRYETLLAKQKAVNELIEKQAKDEGLWFEAKTAPEAYLQQELKKLYRQIETASSH